MRPATRRRLALATGIGALGAGAVAAWRRHTPGSSSGAPVAASTCAVRSAHLARVAGRTGGAYGIHRARRGVRLGRAARGARHRVRAAHRRGGGRDAREHEGRPDEDRPDGELPRRGPARAGARRAGRSSSRRPADDAPSWPPSVVEAELGAPPEELFAEWDPVPIAAASHRPGAPGHHATTGAAVAVKVQYPGVDDAIERRPRQRRPDLRRHAADVPGPRPRAARRRAAGRGCVEELDYRIEAANQQLFADYYARPPVHPRPRRRPRRCRPRRVLTTELADGRPLRRGARRGRRRQRDLAGEAIFRFVFRSLYRLHAFNGDPHPGNYLFHPDGRVTFLDFGLVKRSTTTRSTVFVAMIRAMVRATTTPTAFRRIVERAGMLSPVRRRTDEDRRVLRRTSTRASARTRRSR